MIDVIIPVYNSYATIENTLKSIENQTIKDKLKIYIIDDCSLSSYEYLKSKFNLDITIYTLEKNSGPGVARQYGIEHSNSEFIVFIDSDDNLCENNSLEILYNCINTMNADLIMATTYDEYFDSELINENDLHSKIYRRSFLDEKGIKFNETRYHEDCMFNNLVLIMGARYACLEKVLYNYNNNENSISRNTYEEEFDHLKYLLYNMKCIKDFIKGKEYNKEIYNELIASKYVYINGTHYEASPERKKILLSWVNKYDPINSNVIGIYNSDEIHKIVEKNETN